MSRHITLRVDPVSGSNRRPTFVKVIAPVPHEDGGQNTAFPQSPKDAAFAGRLRSENPDDVGRGGSHDAAGAVEVTVTRVGDNEIPVPVVVRTRSFEKIWIFI